MPALATSSHHEDQDGEAGALHDPQLHLPSEVPIARQATKEASRQGRAPSHFIPILESTKNAIRRLPPTAVFFVIRFSTSSTHRQSSACRPGAIERHQQRHAKPCTKPVNMNSLWPSRPPKEESETSSDEPKAEAADPGEQPSDTTPEQDNLLPPPPPPPVSSSRPGLIRNSSIPPEAPTAPAPPVPMPPVSSASQPPTDSLSLMQLRKIVAEFNKAEPVAYDFAYEDAGPHEEEIDEWFSYQFWQWVRLNAVQSAFESQWQSHYDMASWTDVDDDARTDFLREALDSLQASQQADRLDAARVLLYLSLGRWVDTAVPTRRTHGLKSAASPSQLDAIKSQAIFLTSLDGLRIVWQSIQDCFEAFWFVPPASMAPREPIPADQFFVGLRTRASPSREVPKTPRTSSSTS